jgi:hypothetical protein
VPSKEIYISNILGAKKKRFAAFHEIGHEVLPWHNALFQKCSELDLSLKARKTYDAEANSFAAECIYQGERFGRESWDSSFGLKTVLCLAQRYDVSIESACRRYVSASKEVCAALICGHQGAHILGSNANLYTQYMIRSKQFPAVSCPVGVDVPLEGGFAYVRASFSRKPLRENIIVKFPSIEPMKCRAYIFYTGYKLIVLLKACRFRDSGFVWDLTKISSFVSNTII